jgi:hypothetical protein
MNFIAHAIEQTFPMLGKANLCYLFLAASAWDDCPTDYIE